MVEAKLKNGKTCVYCGKSNGKLDREGCCKACINVNDEELSGYERCTLCDRQVGRGDLIEFDNERACDE